MKCLIIAMVFLNMLGQPIVAQHDFGISINGGISNRWERNETDETEYFKPSWGCGVYYTYYKTEKINFNAELGTNILRYYQEELGYNVLIKKTFGTRILSLPLTMGFNLSKNLSFAGGVQFSFSSGSGSYRYTMYYTNGQVKQVQQEGWSHNWFDFGARTSLTYKPFDRLRIQLNAFQSIIENSNPGITKTNAYWSRFDLSVYWNIFGKKE